MVNISQRTWRPDTCDCIIDYEFDSDLAIDGTIPTPVSTSRVCSIHTDEPNLQDLWNSVTVEHKRKNLVWRNLLDKALPDMIETDPNGNILFKPHINISWSWSGQKPNRVLTMTLTGKTLTANQKTAVQQRLDTAFPNQNIIFLAVNI